ncbi:MotA/TolQ/ExbB proton channel family protein [Alkaliflexus imshenetskii]|uniref:MotA/TolQ/ExbB proton channel family protein n=1 Tax=Alkaliflexus imshenetskii TaxID=286730 RepID=UPI00047ECC51|nr:MotA/TolQ/ExbB proton channel family protein [Alkaliflexus imshenetskii]
METITNTLYWISTGLLVPVVITLLLLFGRSLVLIGSFFGHYTQKVKTDVAIHKTIEQINVNNLSSIGDSLPHNNNSLLVNYIRKISENRGNKPQLQRLLACFEIDADKDLALSKTLTKLGPILGLMGTLIPMGPALVGLATGDIASMAHNMQVAFATTVIGLLTGAIGFITLQVKQRWYLQDFTNLEYLVQLLSQSVNHQKQ